MREKKRVSRDLTGKIDRASGWVAHEDEREDIAKVTPGFWLCKRQVMDNGAILGDGEHCKKTRLLVLVCRGRWKKRLWFCIC